LDEKAGQLTLYTSYWDITGPTMNQDYMQAIRDGKCGNIFNAHSVAYNKSLQKVAVEESRLGIPLLFGYDVVHGHKTIYQYPSGLNQVYLKNLFCSNLEYHLNRYNMKEQRLCFLNPNQLSLKE